MERGPHKRWMCRAVIADAHDHREDNQITAKASRRKHLRNHADTGQRRRIAVAIRPGVWVVREQPPQRTQTGLIPAPEPSLLSLAWQKKRAGQIVNDLCCSERLNVADDELG